MQVLSPQDEIYYRKLQQRLDKLPVRFPPTKTGVEIRILSYLFSPEQVKIALNLSYIPETAKIIYRRMKGQYKDLTSLEYQLEEMVSRGSISSTTTRDKRRLYSLAILAIGMFEFQVAHLTKEFYLDFQEYVDEEFREVLLSQKFEQLRPVPIQASITSELNIIPYDNIRNVISIHRGPFLKAVCVCKEGKDLIGKPCKVTKEREICLIFGSGARNYAENGWGKLIEREEVLEILDRAQKDGLVLQSSNTQDPFCVCLCCSCCCEVLSNLRPLEKPAHYLYNNYQANVNQEKCIGCGLCKDRCQMDAIDVNEKSSVNLDRCIGCGLCVPTCPQEAIHLEKKRQLNIPPKNAINLYIKMMRKRTGIIKMIPILIRVALRMKIP